MANIMLIAFATLLALYASPTIAQLDITAEKGFNECLSETKVSKDDVTSHPPKSTPETQCFLKCMLLKAGKISADGTINIDLIMADTADHISITDQQKTDLKTCLSGAGKIEKCEDVPKIHACYLPIMKH